MQKFKLIMQPQIFMRIFGAAFFGGLATLAFAPYGYWLCMPLALFALLRLTHNQSATFAAVIGFSWGLGQFGTGVSWVYVVIDKFGGMPEPVGLTMIALLVAYLSLYPAAFGFALQRFKLPSTLRYVLLAPSLWLIIDACRGTFLTGFPWLWPGYSQIDSPLAAFAPVFGVQGITLVLLLLAGSATLLTLSKNLSAVLMACLPAAVIVLCGALLNHINWVSPTTEEVDVAIIQGNVPQELKWLPQRRWPTLLNYQDMTRKHWDADLIIWPEAAIPALEFEVTEFLTNLDAAARNNNTALIIGVLDQNQHGKFFNNVITLGENGQGGYHYPAPDSYSKHHLLVFGEFVPFEDILRPIAPFFNLPMSSFSRGAEKQPNLSAKQHQLAPAICYEIAFNEQVRQSLTPDSDFILTLSNDTWFGKSIGPHQHLEIARMRALENGKPVLRSTNTGITAVIGYNGKIIKQIPQFETLVLRTKVATTKGQTPYTQFGNFPLYLWLGLSILALAAFAYLRFSVRRTYQSKC